VKSDQRKAKLPNLPLPRSVLLVGERIIVTGGPLEGSEGFVVEDRSPRVVLSIGLPRPSNVMIEIDRDWITPVSIRTQSATFL
jgi:putative AlgH/UPF0301 family transcriptional regulator